jgi:hypothetical protein
MSNQFSFRSRRKISRIAAERSAPILLAMLPHCHHRYQIRLRRQPCHQDLPFCCHGNDLLPVKLGSIAASAHFLYDLLH